MAINTDPDNLRIEAEAAIRLRRRHTDLSAQLIERMCGSAYREDWVPDSPSHENHEFEYLVNILPALLANNPKVNVKSRRPVIQRELAEGMAHGLNRWVKDVNLVARLEQCVEDAQFDFGVVMVSLEPLPGYEDVDRPPLRPTLYRISPRRYFKDPQGGPTGPRFAGHIIIRDMDDMLEDRGPDGKAKFDAEAVKGLASPDGANELVDDEFFHDIDIRVDRNQVVYAEMYMYETGMIHTIGFSSVPGENGKRGGRQLRKPRPFFGPVTGPYIELGFYLVPDQVYPLAPLAVTHDLVTEINAHAEQVSRDSDTARNLVLYDMTNAALGDALQNFANGTVAGIPGFDQQAFAEVSMGGANPAQLDYIQRLRERIDRRSGLTDIQRGNVTGDATATEAQLAAASSNARTKFMQRKVITFVTRILEHAAWLMFHSSSVVFPIPIEEADSLVFNGYEAVIQGRPMFEAKGPQTKEAVFYGGPQPGQEDSNFYDLELEIQPYSMEQVNEAVLQKRMSEAFAMTVQAAGLIMQYPFLNWPELLDDYYQSINIPDGRKYINFEQLAQMLQVQWQMGQVRGIAGIDGAPPLDLQTFKGPAGMPAGQRAGDIQNAGGEGGGAGSLASILGQAVAA